MNISGFSFAAASAWARFLVPATRLLRIFAFFAGVQRPTMLSPARCMTASKPETASGEIGCAGSQRIRSSPLVELWLEEARAPVPRVNRATCAPLDFNDGNSADPIGPDAPLTRMRDIRTLTMV